MQIGLSTFQGFDSPGYWVNTVLCWTEHYQPTSDLGQQAVDL